jgi:hypothetical protein
MNYHSNCSKYNQEEPNSSGIWATLDLTNPIGINNTRHQSNSVINVQGRLYNLFDGLGKPGYTVIIYIDGTPYHSFNDITDGNGDFDIAFTVDPFLDVYTPHWLEVIVDNPIPPGDVDYTSYYNISISTTSYLNVNNMDTPFIPGENLLLNGYLRCYNLNGTGISNAQINYYWYNSSHNWASNSFFTSPTDGSISQSISIPINAFSEKLYLNLSYSGDSPYINSTQKTLSINLFWDINCEWNTSIIHSRYIIEQLIFTMMEIILIVQIQIQTEIFLTLILFLLVPVINLYKLY